MLKNAVLCQKSTEIEVGIYLALFPHLAKSRIQVGSLRRVIPRAIRRANLRAILLCYYSLVDAARHYHLSKEIIGLIIYIQISHRSDSANIVNRYSYSTYSNASRQYKTHSVHRSRSHQTLNIKNGIIKRHRFKFLA